VVRQNGRRQRVTFSAPKTTGRASREFEYFFKVQMFGTSCYNSILKTSKNY
jgi:hypothetical protein